MKKRYYFLLMITALCLSNLSNALNLSLNPDTSNSINTRYTLTINNTDTLSNISLINISVPYILNYVQNTNFTSANNSYFVNNTDYIYWANTTQEGIVSVNSTELFQFNFSGNAEYNGSLIVNITYVNGTNESYTLSLFIDTVKPLLIFTYPSGNSNIITKENEVIINYSYSESYPKYFIAEVLLNGTSLINSTNHSLHAGTQVNASVALNISSLSDGIYDLKISMNDTLDNYNSTLLSDSLIVDRTSPEIHLNSPSNNSWSPLNNNIVFEYVPFSYSGIDNCSIHILNSTNDEIYTDTNTTVSNNQTNVFNYSVNETNETYIYWYIECVNNVGLNNTSQLYRLNLGDRSDLNVESISFSELYPRKGDTLNISVNVSNTGTSYMVNNTNITFYFGTASNPCSQTPTNITLLNASVFTTGSFKIINYTISDLNASDYYICVKIDPENVELETEEANNQKEAFISTLLKIAVIEVNDTDARPGNNISIKFNVTYYDNSPFTTLSFGDISLSDKWVEDGRSVISSSTIYEKNFSESSSGIYEIYHTVKNHVIGAGDEYGRHDIILSVDSGNYTGTGTGNYTYISPYLEITWYDVDTSMEVDQTKRVRVKVKNIGNEKIDIYTFKLYIPSTSADYLSASFYNCDTSKETLDSDEYKECYVDIKAKKDGTDKRIALNASGNITDPLRYYTLREYTPDIDISTAQTSTSTSTSTTNENDDADDEEKTLGDECSKDSDCASTLYCNTKLKKCDVVKCTNGKVVDHKCRTDANISILTDKEYDLLEGTVETYTVFIENTGFIKLTNLSFNALCNDKPEIISFKEYKSYVYPGKKLSAKMVINTTNIDVGRYRCVINVKFKEASFNKSFKLIVIPNNETKKLISEKIKELDEKIQEVLEYYESIRDDIPEEIQTQIFNTVNSLLLKYNETKRSVDEGDYITAYKLQNELSGDLLNTENILESTEKEIEAKTHKRLKYTLVILLILALIGGVFYYLWTPPTTEKEIDPIKQIYNKNKKQDNAFILYWDKLKEQISKLGSKSEKSKTSQQTTIHQYRYNPKKK